VFCSSDDDFSRRFTALSMPTRMQLPAVSTTRSSRLTWWTSNAWYALALSYPSIAKTPAGARNSKRRSAELSDTPATMSSAGWPAFVDWSTGRVPVAPCTVSCLASSKPSPSGSEYVPAASTIVSPDPDPPPSAYCSSQGVPLGQLPLVAPPVATAKRSVACAGAAVASTATSTPAVPHIRALGMAVEATDSPVARGATGGR